MKTAGAALALLLLAACGSAAPPLMWEYKIAGSISTDLNVDHGIVYFGTSTGRLIGVNVTTGLPVMNYSSTAPVYSSPAVSGGSILFGSDNKILYSVNASTGNRTWASMTAGMIRSSPNVVDDTVYIGSDDGRLYAMRVSSGNVIWKYKTGAAVSMAPLKGMWRIYVGSGRNFFAISNLTGSPIWNATLGGSLKTNPASYKELVYVAADDRRLYALNEYTGKVLWNYTANGTIAAPPLVLGDNVLIGAAKRVISLGTYSGGLTWNSTLNETIQSKLLEYDGLIYVGAGNSVYAINGTSGEVLWGLNSAFPVKYRPAYDKGVLIVPSGGALRAYGGTADVRVDKISLDPAMPASGRPFRLKVSMGNSGSAVAPDVDLNLYVDTANYSTRKLSLAPGEEATVTYNMTASNGRHLVEAVADEDQRIIDYDRKNNYLSLIFSPAAEWPTFRQNNNRTGFIELKEGYRVRDKSLSWTCKLNRSNMTMDNAAVIWSALNSNEAFKLGNLALNYSCTASPTRGYYGGRLNSTWSCIAYNTTNYSDKNFLAMREYIRTFNESEYNLSLRHNALEYPFDVENYTVYFNCTSGAQTELPVLDAKAFWDCRVKRNYTITPYNLTGSWACSARYQSNFSMEDLVSLKTSNSVTPGRGGDNRSEATGYGVLWSYQAKDFIESSPIIVDLDNSGDGQLETVFGSHDHYIRAIDSKGRLIWATQLGGIAYSVSASDINLDGMLELLAGSSDGAITALNSTGGIIWSYKTAGPVKATPLALNIDDTPMEEVITGSQDGKIYVLDSLGRHMWNYTVADSIDSSATAADIDADGKKEVIFGSNDNVLYALKTPPYKVWMFPTGGDISGSPSVLYRPRSRTAEVITPSWDGSLYDLYYGSAGAQIGARICTSTGCENGKIEISRFNSKWSFSSDGPIESSAGIADLDGDGQSEMVFGSSDDSIYILNSSGGRVMKYTTSKPVRSSAALADVNGDGLPEAIIGSDDGRVYVLNATEKIWDFRTGGPVRSSAAVADIDGDGRPEFAVGSDDGRLYMFSAQIPLTTTTTTIPATTTLATSSTMVSTTTLSSMTSTTPVSSTTSTTTSSTLASTTTTEAATTTTAPAPEGNANKSAESMDYTAIYMSVAAIMTIYSFIIMYQPKKPRMAGRLKFI